MKYINRSIQKILLHSSLLLLMMLCLQVSKAQVNDTLTTKQDSVSLIKQLVKEHILITFEQNASYKKLQQNKISELLKDSSVVDTLSKLVLEQMQQIKNTAINTGKSAATGALHTSKQLLQQQFEKIVQTQQVKSLFGQFTGMLQQPLLKWQGGSVRINGQTAPSLFNSGTVFINSNVLNSNWSVMGIPVGLQLLRQDFTGPEYHSRNTFSFQFDREAYLNSLRDKVKLKIKAKDLLPDYNDALQKIKQSAVQRLQSSLDSINTSYKGVLSGQLQQVGDLKNIFSSDVNSLQDKLLSPEYISDLESKKNLLSQMQNQMGQGAAVNKLMYDSLLQSVQAVEGINKMITTIKNFKDEVQKSGLLEKLKEAEQFKNDNMQQWLQEPDKLKSLAKEQLDLNGLQKLFLNVNQLHVGMNTVNLSPLTVYQYANTGVNAEFVNNKTYLFIMAGRQKEFGNVYDNRFAGSSLFSTDNSSMGIRAGKGDLQNSHSHFSFFTYKQNKSSYTNNLISVVPGTTVVTTFSNQIKFNEANYLNVEVSKSSHKYDNQQNMYDTLRQNSSLSKQILSGDNFIQQVAVTVQWNGEIKDRQLNYDIHGTSIGKGYNNPGSIFLSRGMTELGGSVKKSFLKNQLQLSARGNYREYEYGNSDTKWRNYNFSFQSKWKLKKGQYIALRYQPFQSVRWQNDKKYTIGESNRLSLDVSIRRRFGKINYQNVFSLSSLKNNYRFDSLPANNNSILISSLQSININKKSYYLNAQYNKATNPSVFAIFNTQFNADAGVMYSIGKGIMGSTALNYNSTKGWFKQVGIKQSVSGQIGERFLVSFYTDILKNIKEYRPNNMDNLRLDWSLQYSIK
jgi:hypothetical protein